MKDDVAWEKRSFTSSNSKPHHTKLKTSCSCFDLQPFAISPRNSPAAIAHLLKSTDCKHAYVQFNPHLPSSESKEVTEILSRQQIQETLQLLPDAHLPQLHEMPTASDLYTRLAHRSSYQQNLDLIKELDAMPCTTPPAHLPVIMVHSSGTTAFPKPIHVNRLGIQGWLKTSQYGRFNCQAQILASMVLPPFHAMGITFGFLINLTEGSISGLFRPKFNQIGHSKLSTIPNSMNVISAIRDLNCTIASFSPVMLSVGLCLFVLPSHELFVMSHSLNHLCFFLCLLFGLGSGNRV